MKEQRTKVQVQSGVRKGVSLLLAFVMTAMMLPASVALALSSPSAQASTQDELMELLGDYSVNEITLSGRIAITSDITPADVHGDKTIYVTTDASAPHHFVVDNGVSIDFGTCGTVVLDGKNNFGGVSVPAGNEQTYTLKNVTIQNVSTPDSVLYYRTFTTDILLENVVVKNCTAIANNKIVILNNASGATAGTMTLKNCLLENLAGTYQIYTDGFLALNQVTATYSNFGGAKLGNWTQNITDSKLINTSINGSGYTAPDKSCDTDHTPIVLTTEGATLTTEQSGTLTIAAEMGAEIHGVAASFTLIKDGESVAVSDVFSAATVAGTELTLEEWLAGSFVLENGNLALNLTPKAGTAGSYAFAVTLVKDGKNIAAVGGTITIEKSFKELYPRAGEISRLIAAEGYSRMYYNNDWSLSKWLNWSNLPGDIWEIRGPHTFIIDEVVSTTSVTEIDGVAQDPSNIAIRIKDNAELQVVRGANLPAIFNIDAGKTVTFENGPVVIDLNYSAAQVAAGEGTLAGVEYTVKNEPLASYNDKLVAPGDALYLSVARKPNDFLINGATVKSVYNETDGKTVTNFNTNLANNRTYTITVTKGEAEYSFTATVLTSTPAVKVTLTQGDETVASGIVTKEPVTYKLSTTNNPSLGTIAWEYSADNGETWTALEGDTLTVEGEDAAVVTYLYKFRATSLSGKTYTTTLNYKVTIDRKAPVLVSITPALLEGATAHKGAVTLTFDEIISRVDFTGDANGCLLMGGSKTVKSSDLKIGDGTYTLTAYDRYGNALENITFTIDSTPASAIAVAPEALGTDLKNGPIKFTVSGKNDSEVYQYRITTTGEWQALDGDSLTVYPDPYDETVINKAYQFRAVNTINGVVSGVRSYTLAKQKGMWLEIDGKAYKVDATTNTIVIGKQVNVSTLKTLYYAGSGIDAIKTLDGKDFSGTMKNGQTYVVIMRFDYRVWATYVTVNTTKAKLNVTATVGNAKGAEYVKNTVIGGTTAQVYFKLDTSDIAVTDIDAFYYSEDNGVTWKKLSAGTLGVDGSGIVKTTNLTFKGTAGVNYAGTFRFKVVTKAGLETVVSFGAVKIDKAAPVLQEQPAPAEGYEAHASNIKFIFDEAVTLTGLKDGEVFTALASNNAPGRTIQLGADAAYTNLVATDAFGNELAIEGDFVKSGVKPALTVTPSVKSGKETTGDIVFNFTSNFEPFKVQWSIDGTTWADIALSADGKWTLENGTVDNSEIQFRALNSLSGAIGGAKKYTVNFVS